MSDIDPALPFCNATCYMKGLRAAHGLGMIQCELTSVTGLLSGSTMLRPVRRAVVSAVERTLP
jgi:hypothetical protein